MPRVPTTVQDLLNFCNEHGTVWQAAAATIGLTPAQVTAFKTVTSDATAAVAAQATAKEAAKSATVTSRKDIALLRTSVAGMIRSITTFAAAQANPDAVYAAAQIPPPQPRTPSEPPGQPTNITATLDDEGNITLKWKCVNPASGNVVYNISRRTDEDADFAPVGFSGARSFLDDSIPAGSPSVQYTIRGFRGQTVGPASAIFTLQFGHGGGGLSIVAASMEGPKKLAA